MSIFCSNVNNKYDGPKVLIKSVSIRLTHDVKTNLKRIFLLDISTNKN